MTKYNFEVDHSTDFILRIIGRYLKKYFNYDSDENVISAINNLYSIMRPIQKGDEEEFLELNFHHDHPFQVASRIHYFNNAELQKKYSNVINWLRDINWFIVPKEADEDYRKWSEEEGGVY